MPITDDYRDGLKQLIDLNSQVAGHIIQMWEGNRNLLQALTEHPWSLESFPAAEVMEINRKGRQIAGIIADLQRIRETMPDRTEEELLGDTIEECLESYRSRAIAINLYIIEKREKIRQPTRDENLTAWLAHPLKMIGYTFRAIRHRRLIRKIAQRYEGHPKSGSGLEP